MIRPSQQLADLLAQLSQPHLPHDLTWNDWRIQRIGGGRNNLLYHAEGPGGDFAVKFTIRDKRDRAGREYAGLRALRAAGLAIAPEPVLLDRIRYPQPVVVQTWLDGDGNPVESCQVCHGPKGEFSVELVHNIVSPYKPPYLRTKQ